MDKENKLILYKDDEGRVSVNTRFADEDVWLTQAPFFILTRRNCFVIPSRIIEQHPPLQKISEKHSNNLP